MKNSRNVFLSLGTNLGNKLKNIIVAIIELNKIKNIKIIDISSFYVSEPVGYTNQPDFINFGVYIKTLLKPYELLKELNKIEDKLFRVREKRWDKRIIDIDIIYYGNIDLKRKDLIIPHKEYKKRNFVLEPLFEIYPCIKRSKKNLRNGKIKKVKLNENILLSSCLAGLNTKYNGSNNYNRIFKLLSNKINFIPICPEQLGGMPTPRQAVEIQSNGRVKDKNGNDYTDKFENGAIEALKTANLLNTKLALLKSGSPSCGYGNIYDGTFEKRMISGNGVTSRLFIKNNIEIIEI